MKKLIFIMFFLSAALSFAQQKYALVIGNGNYSSPDWRKLPNPANDASDMKAALEKLGFQVEHVINGNLDQMERAVTNFRRKLNNSRNSYGFFFYAGHGVQYQGENYLIPVDANIPSRNSLSQRALSVSFVLKELEDAKNELNIIVIDACREFLPDSWDKDRNSSTRGLAPVQVPRGSIVSFATAANSVAADGDGRNGLYTGFLLKNITTPGLDINEVFRRTGSDVERATSGKQYPETRYMYHEIVYLGSKPNTNITVQPVPEGLEFEINENNSITITGYSGYDAIVRIPEKIQGLPVTEITYGFQYNSDLTSVTLPKTVTSISSYVFGNCENLTSITVDNLNPSYTSVNGVLFDKNIRTIVKYPAGKKDKSFNIPATVTTIGVSAFSGCKNLTGITIPSSVTTIDDNAFSYCSNLTSLSIPASVTSLGDNTFYYCSSLTSINIPSSVTSFGYNMIGGCSSLTSINVDNRNSVYASIDGVVTDKAKKTIIIYPKGKTGAYSIPSSITAIEDRAFSGCGNLTSVTIPSSVTTLGYYVFYESESLTSITADSRNPAFASIDGILFDKNIKTIIAYPAGKKTETYALPSTITSIKIGAFIGCKYLSNITIPSSVTSIESYAFYYCNNLTNVNFSRPFSVESIGEGAFYGCNNLTNITIPSSVIYIGDSAFRYCDNLTNVTIPSSVEYIGDHAFYYCDNITNVTILSSAASIGNYAFYGCNNLTEVIISRKSKIGENAFPEAIKITYRN